MSALPDKALTTAMMAQLDDRCGWGKQPHECPLTVLFGDGLPIEQAQPILELWAEERARLNPDEWAQAGTSVGSNELVEYNLTELGNAERFADDHAHDLRYCPQNNRWYIWNGRFWREDTTGARNRRAKKTVRKMSFEADQINPTEAATKSERDAEERRRQSIVRHVNKSETEHGIKAMLNLARSESSLVAGIESLDGDPWLFNVQNGTLDLKTGNLLPHDKEHMITKSGNVSYKPDSNPELWSDFVSEILDGDGDLYAFLRRLTGYSLTGDVSEQILPFLYGTGRNGKSTFLETVRDILGDYYQKAPRSLIQLRRSGDEGVPTDIARLQGARMVVCPELDEGRRMAESQVKDLTGSERIAARYMRQDFFEFDPTHKLWICGNHRPVIQGTDFGIWRRIMLVPFNVVIPEKKVDPQLKTKLLSEKSGILNWMLDGLRDWQENGLNPPDAVRGAVDAYRTDMDVFGEFLEDVCIDDPQAWTASAELYEAYKAWGTTSGDGKYLMSQRTFGTRLSDRGYQRDRDSSTGARGYRGLRIGN